MMNAWHGDNELFALICSELFTSVVGDVMDKLQLFHQFLPPAIRPLREDMVLIGRAMPVFSADVSKERISEGDWLMDKPFGLMLEALDDLRPNEVYLNTVSSPQNAALWGEMMSTRAIRLGATGAVLNGYSRDTKAVLNLNFPTFSLGSYGQDSAARYKVVEFRIPLEIGSVRVKPGDILFGDLDGVLVVPREAETEVFSKAIEKARGEKLVKKALEQGSTAVAAFEKYGIM